MFYATFEDKYTIIEIKLLFKVTLITWSFSLNPITVKVWTENNPNFSTGSTRETLSTISSPKRTSSQFMTGTK